MALLKISLQHRECSDIFLKFSTLRFHTQNCHQTCCQDNYPDADHITALPNSTAARYAVCQGYKGMMQYIRIVIGNFREGTTIGKYRKALHAELGMLHYLKNDSTN